MSTLLYRAQPHGTLGTSFQRTRGQFLDALTTAVTEPALMTATAALAAIVTWAAMSLIIDTGRDRVSSLSGPAVVSTQNHAEAVAALSPEQLVRTYGNIFDHAPAVATLSPAQLAAAYGNVFGPQVVDRVQAITEMTPEQLAGAYGNMFDPGAGHSEAIADLSAAQLAASWGNVFDQGR